MKSMNNFAAQQLSKKQMNEVRGGDSHIWCTAYFDDQEESGISTVDTEAEAERLLYQKYEGIYDDVFVVCEKRFN